jgi:hypothetical protein
VRARARRPGEERPAAGRPAAGPHNAVLQLQRMAGNAAATQLLQRQAAAVAPLTKRAYEVPGFEFSGGAQTPGKGGNGALVDLAFDPSTNTFTCTFRLRWRSFPHDPPNLKLGWQEAESQQKFKDRFVQTVRSAWENKFPLTEYQGGVKTARAATVVFKFEELVDNSKGTVEEITAASKLPPEEIERRKTRYDIDVSLEDVRDKVTAGSIVSIDAGSLSPEKHGKFTQVTAVHEFGHMIGLADEYVLSPEDYQEVLDKLGEAEAKRRKRERKKNTGRIMSVGSNVTRDDYQPFARWLSDLTGGDWRV